MPTGRSKSTSSVYAIFLGGEVFTLALLTFLVGFLLGGIIIGDAKECSYDVPHYGLESSDHGLRAAPVISAVSLPQDRAAEGRPIPDRDFGLYLILGIAVGSLGILAAARIARWIVGRLMDAWGMEC